MIFAYVSDEFYSALPGVAAELLELPGGLRLELSSSATGALSADVPAGLYRLTLACTPL